MDSNSESVELILATLLEKFSHLTEFLDREKQVLIDRQMDDLLEITESKNAVSLEIHALEYNLRSVLPGAGTNTKEEATSDLDTYIKSLPAQSKEVLRALHSDLKSKIADAKHANEVNGKIVHRTQQSTRELMKLLLGDDGSVYTAAGHTRAQSAAQSIAQV